ncbi:LuxR C-terminal-related transcriptional regulator [Desulfovibrio sp. OttesenSCG-928-I05]|nr:LuxR C-terminal-related transcriptional regulator [Desulfovibrio sp. OttesenSCG-928-I05]
MPSQATFLPRREVTDTILNAVRQYSLTAIVAPMGYGKTTLARSLAESLDGSTYYYATPTGPHDAPFLWHDMFRQFEAQGMSIAPAMLRLGFPAAASQWRQALDLLHSLTSLTTPACLLLDDCHLITDTALFGFWERAVRANIPNFRIVLFSRIRPEISLVELCIKQYATVFEQDILAFSETETREFFRLHGISENAAAIEAQKYSEGWPAALWLCLQSWQASGSLIESQNIDSLLAAVFAAYSPEERDLLMRLSVLESFTDQDAQAIATLPHSTANLRTLRDKNPFLTFDTQRERYQFHAIFRDFLRKELGHAARIDTSALCRLAGECCAERQEVIAAFRLLVQAGRDEDLQRALDMFLLPEYDKGFVFFQDEIFAATTAIPWHIRLQNPMGYLAFVLMCLVLWNDARAVSMLDEAEERFRNAPDIPEFMRKRLRGEFEVIRGLSVFNDAWALRDHYEEACRLIDGPSVVLSDSTAWSYGSPSISFITLRDAGRYEELLELTEQHWHLCNKLTNGTTKGGEKAARAECWLERGEFATAGELAREVLNCCGAARHVAAALSAVFCLARISLISGESQKALQILDIPRLHVEQLGVTEHFDCIDMAIGYINAVLGKVDAIPEWLRNGEIYDPPHNSLPQVFGLSLTIYGKALLLQGDYQRVLSLADEIPVASAPLECLFSHIHGKTLKAIAVWHARSQNEALELLREALELSRPDGIILPLAEYGPDIVPLLRLLKRTAREDAHLAAVLTLAERITRATGRQDAPKELLAPREMEVMRHVVEGKSNLAIAKSLNVSPETVKKTLMRVYKKLGVANRTEAAHRYMELHSEKNPLPSGF